MKFALTPTEIDMLVAINQAKPKVDDDTMDRIIQLILTLDVMLFPGEGDTLTWRTKLITYLVIAAYWIGREQKNSTQLTNEPI